MNRQQRRALERKESKSVTLCVNESHLRSEIDKAILFTIQTMNAVYALVLNAEHNFGAQRINNTINRAMNQFQCIESGHLTAKDIKEWCNDKQINYKGGL